MPNFRLVLHNSDSLIRKKLQDILSETILQCAQKGEIAEELTGKEVGLETPREASHGDFTTNFAMMHAKIAKANPREVATHICNALAKKSEFFEKVEVAGPGFINMSLSPEFVSGFLHQVVSNPDSFGSFESEESQKINVEFVSVNPNGPITIGSGRGAAYGSALCNVLEAAGHTVCREYYINDGVNSEQMRLFAESVKAIMEGREIPDNGYKGDYVEDVANAIQHYNQAPKTDLTWYQNASQKLMLDKQKKDLEAFSVTYDTWFSEQSLHDNGQVQTEVDHLIQNSVADEKPYRTELKLGKGGVIKEVNQTPQEKPGALWLRSTKFGDDADRVLKRADGRLTYISSDVAYHRDKFNRPANATKLITVLGPDHHGYISRLEAVVAADLIDQVEPIQNETPLNEHEAKIYTSIEERNRCQAALEEARKRLTVQIFQIVRFLKDGKPAPMRKRDGNIYALIDLINEIGKEVKPNSPLEDQQQAGSDVARFFYLMRHHDTALDFDLELATKQSDENPVFYVQYAHARICSVLEKAKEEEFETDKTLDNIDLSVLTHEREKTLLLKIYELENEVERTADDYSVNRIANYSMELARTFHYFYDGCRVVDTENKPLSEARIAVCRGAQIALKRSLELLGISAPEKMIRAEYF